MNFTRIREVLQGALTELDTFESNLLGAIQGAVGKKTKAIPLDPSSKHQIRKANKTTKEKLWELFKKNPSRGFTMQDVCTRFKGVARATVSRQVKYLTSIGRLEKVGNAFRLRNENSIPVEKVKKSRKRKQKMVRAKPNGASSERKAELQAAILEQVSAGPKTLEELRRMDVARGDFYTVKKLANNLRRDGLIRQEKVPFINKRKHHCHIMKFVSKDFQIPASA